MSVDSVCPRCDSRMIYPRFDDDPMYCMVCGAQGDMPPPSKTTKFSETKGGKAARSRSSSTIHTARYRGAEGGPRFKGMESMTVRYRMTHADRQIPLPALIVACPWCGGVTRSQSWAAPKSAGRWRASSTERYMYIECPSSHTYSMVCDASGDYYWR